MIGEVLRRKELAEKPPVLLVNPHGVCVHSLRYTFATHLLRAGVPIKTVQRLGRWKTVDVLLKVYANSFPADERAAVEWLPYMSVRSGQEADAAAG